MNDYDTIVGHMKSTDDHDMGETTDELARIKQLGGIQ
jgi:hypothetical protein